VIVDCLVFGGACCYVAVRGGVLVCCVVLCVHVVVAVLPYGGMRSYMVGCATVAAPQPN
jgi:hypothetical protein